MVSWESKVDNFANPLFFSLIIIRSGLLDWVICVYIQVPYYYHNYCIIVGVFFVVVVVVNDEDAINSTVCF